MSLVSPPVSSWGVGGWESKEGEKEGQAHSSTYLYQDPPCKHHFDWFYIDEQVPDLPEESSVVQYTIQYITVYHSILRVSQYTTDYHSIPQSITVYHRVSQYTTDYHSIPQSITVYHRVSQYTTEYHSISQSITVYHSILQHNSQVQLTLHIMPHYVHVSSQTRNEAHLDGEDEVLACPPVSLLHGMGSCHHMFTHALRRTWGKGQQLVDMHTTVASLQSLPSGSQHALKVVWE